MPLRICHIITTIDLGGAEKQLLVLASSQRAEGAEVEIIFLKGLPALKSAFIGIGIDVNMDYQGLSFWKQLLKLKSKELDKSMVFHAHLPRAELLCSLALPKETFVVTRHNAENFYPGAPRAISIVLSKFVTRRAFATVSISKAVLSYLESSREVHKLGINEVIYYGLENTEIVLPTKKRIKESNFHIGTVSRLVPQKNLPLLFEALSSIKSDVEGSLTLSIAGEGPLKQYLEELAENLEIRSSITWLGKVGNIESFYKNIDLFVFPSNYEGFGLVLLEAMSYGLPIIARRISAIPEVLGQDHPGLVSSDSSKEFGEKILEFSKNAKLRELCISYQKEQLRYFSISKSQKQHNKIYKNMLMKRDWRETNEKD